MHPSLQKIIQNKAVVIPVAVMGGFTAVGLVVFFLFATRQNLTNKTAVTQKTPIQIMRDKQTKLRLTLEQEKKDRAKVHEAMDAPNHYQKLAR